MSGNGSDADPWRDLPVDWPVRSPLSLLQAYKVGWHGTGEGEWRDFAKLPGARLSWVYADAGDRLGLGELRNADQQTIASWRYPPTITISASGRTFTQKTVTRSSRPYLAGIDGYFPPGSGKLRATINRVKLELTGFLDETGMPVLYAIGRHLNGSAGGRITFPDQRWLRFPVRGTGPADAIMTAVDQSGNKIARYRLTGKSSWAHKMRNAFLHRRDTVEIAVHPGQPLTDELMVALAISAVWLNRYFDSGGDGGG
jgi:hypothetical protein